MRSTLARLNQSSVNLDADGVRTVQAASRPDWDAAEQLVLVTIPDVSSRLSSAVRTSVGPRVEVAEGLPLTRRQRANDGPEKIRIELPLRAEQMEPSVDWISPPSESPLRRHPSPPAVPVEPKTPVTPPADTSAPRPSGQSAFVESVVSRFQVQGSFVLHFCDSESSWRAAQSCLSAAMELADRLQRQAVVIDAALEERQLSRLLGVDIAGGFREIVRTELAWRDLLKPTSHPLVQVLPAGMIKLPASTATGPFELQTRRLFAELKSQFGVICVCTDTAFDRGVNLVSPCCDGSYLTIDCQSSSRGLARSAVSQLRAAGTRLMGCLAMPRAQA